MIIGILKEITGEKRVAMLPDQAGILAKSGIEVWVETGAGIASFATDEQYQSKGIKVSTRAEILLQTTILLSFNPLPEVDYASIQKKCSVGWRISTFI